MKYDLVKDKLANAITLFPDARRLFYKVLDEILLRQWYIKTLMRKYCKKDEPLSFYDAGAGFCQYSYEVLKRFPNSEVLAVDIKADYLHAFKNFAEDNLTGSFTVKEADLQKYVPNKKYDMAIAIDILEHIEDDVSVIQNFHKCLKEGGILLISTPSTFDEAAAFTEEHVRPGYNKNELEDKLTRNGFELVESFYSYGKFGKLAWKLGMKIPIQLAGLGIFGMLASALWLAIFFPLNHYLMRLDTQTDNEVGNGIIIVAERV
ncbi:MAG: class I SAM-dependent methyltransferase [Candidatus Zophobacter franzmannii]|nr:class I SAM-dependent methyltransferase [Candidatus Zophobacter franzmannii]